MNGGLLGRMSEAMHRGVDEATRQGASGARIHFSHSVRSGCGFENGRLKETEQTDTAYYRIDVVSEGRRASVSGNDPADMSEMVGRALALVRLGAVAHFEAYPAPTPTISVPMACERTSSLTRESLIEACERMVAIVREEDPDLFLSASGSRSSTEALLVTSGGVHHATRATSWSIGCSAQKTTGTDMLFAGYGRRWRQLGDLFDPSFIASEVVKDLRHGARVVEPPTGRLPILLPPEAVSMLLMPVWAGIDGRNVAKGDSPLRERLMEQVLDPCLSLVDCPHTPFAPGAAEIDDSGIPTREQTVVDRGVLRTFLYDLDSAGLADAQPTGNSGCAPYYPKVLPGDRPAAALLASIGDGLLVKEVIGVGQSNVMNGDLAGNVALGFRVRDGEIVGRVKDTMIAANVYEVLRSGVSLSAEVEPVSGMPWLLVDGVTVSAMSRQG
ncbi:MAG TPA: TldD/PmbA family protein [Chthonomonadales bacterium]|nr:TldD/PmbA family protein [Chthonomonadales bacterium]